MKIINPCITSTRTLLYYKKFTLEKEDQMKWDEGVEGGDEPGTSWRRVAG
jgi:hypothetical protein